MAPPTELAVPGGLEPALVAPPPEAQRPALRRLRDAGTLWLPVALLAFIFFMCFIWPLIGGIPKPIGGSILNANLPSFSPGHLLGTDATGNDEWSRLLNGGRTSLEIALAVNAIGIVIGGLLGAFAGFFGGLRDAVVMRVLDVFIAFPSLVLAVAVAERLGPGELHAIYALSFFSVPAFARVTRAGTLRVRESNFIAAADLSGTGSLRTLIRHVAPNVMPEVVTFALLGMGITIVLEGALSFLGLGIPQPAPSWGNMIASGEGILSAQPKFVLLPSGALVLAVIAFNLLGENLRARWSR